MSIQVKITDLGVEHVKEYLRIDHSLDDIFISNTTIFTSIFNIRTKFS